MKIKIVIGITIFVLILLLLGKYFVPDIRTVMDSDGHVEVYELKYGLFRHGKAHRYSNNGVLIGKGNYALGKQDGLFVNYYTNGNTLDSGFYKNGKMEGDFFGLDSMGNLRIITKFNEGRSVWNKFYLENGNISTFEKFIDEDKKAITKYYDDESVEWYAYYESDSLKYWKKYSSYPHLEEIKYPINLSLDKNMVCLELLHSHMSPEILKCEVYLFDDNLIAQDSLMDDNCVKRIDNYEFTIISDETTIRRICKSELRFETDSKSICFPFHKNEISGIFAEYDSRENIIWGYVYFTIRTLENETTFELHGLQFSN